MTQYHALALLYAIKKHDRLAVSKVVAANVKSAQSSPLAMCLLVRAVSQLIRENPSSRSDPVLTDFLDNALRFHNDMVVFEAASCIISLPDASTRDFNAVVGACQSYLTSQKPTRRYGALRLLSRVASLNAAAVATCNLDLESLLTDSNRAIATLAITTLLKTGAENSVERLMKQMQSFLSDISDDHKIVVVEAIRSLCFKYPSKHRVLISHLQSTILYLPRNSSHFNQPCPHILTTPPPTLCFCNITPGQASSETRAATTSSAPSSAPFSTWWSRWDMYYILALYFSTIFGDSGLALAFRFCVAASRVCCLCALGCTLLPALLLTSPQPQLPESKDHGLSILCEFIEDCEYPNLSASVLHILGQHGPSSATPSK
jgi:hypothetical protein